MVTGNLKVETVEVNELAEFPGNARRGDLDELKRSLKANGQYKPIVAQRSTSHVLAGNNTLKAAIELGWETVEVVFVDVDDEEARRINLADNRTADLASYDMEALAELLADISGFEGTGYTMEDLDDLIASVEEVTEVKQRFVSDPDLDKDGEQMNARMTHDRDFYAERYASKTTRVLMCDYPNDTYVWLMEQFAQIRAEHGLLTNGQAVVKLAELATGSTAPAEVTEP